MKAKLIFTLFFFIFFSGCSKKILVQTDYLRPADFSEYRTFRFNDDKAEANFTFNKANQERVRNAIANEMNKRDYIQSELADLLINVQGSIEMIRETGTAFDPFAFRGRWAPGLYPYNNVGPREENESIVIINVIEEVSNKLLWQGVASGDFKQKKKHIEVVISETITRVFEEFPYNPHRKENLTEN